MIKKSIWRNLKHKLLIYTNERNDLFIDIFSGALLAHTGSFNNRRIGQDQVATGKCEKAINCGWYFITGWRRLLWRIIIIGSEKKSLPGTGLPASPFWRRYAAKEK